MSGLVTHTALASLVMISFAPARAWAPETRVEMLDEAVRLMPASLRLALENRRDALLGGMLEPMIAEDGPEHRPPWAAGTLDEQLEREVAALLETLREPVEFDLLARRFGGLAHWVLDAGFPPGASEGDGATRYAHFAAFCDSRRKRFPFVFYGHEDARLEAADYRDFALRVMRTASENDRTLERVYAAAGDPPDASHFGDRSVPFAIGALSYSQSITHVVRLWVSVWERAGGDMGRMPYWKQDPTGTVGRR